jgi:hypothetical protein
MPEFEDMVLGDVDSEQLGEEDLFETLVVPDQQDAFGGDACACTCHNSSDDKYRSRAAHCVSCGTRVRHVKAEFLCCIFYLLTNNSCICVLIILIF